MAAEPTTRQLVVFSIGTEEYALGIEYVHEIIRYVEPRTVSTSDPSVCGVISLRGRIIPVLDLCERLGVSLAAPPQDSRIVIVTDGSETIGVLVDSVTEVITVELESFSDAPVAGADYISAVAQIDERLLVLLDPAMLTGAMSARTDDESQAAA